MGNGGATRQRLLAADPTSVLAQLRDYSGSGGVAIAVEANDFQSDEPIQPDTFVPVLPGEYTRTPPLAMPAPSEEALIDSLRSFASITGGSYPGGLVSWQLVLGTALAIEQSVDSVNAAASLAPLIDRYERHLAKAVAAGLFYVDLVKQGAAPAYFGDRVTIRDADAVLLRWRLPDGRTRVVFGNLTTSTLDASETPAGK